MPRLGRGIRVAMDFNYTRRDSTTKRESAAFGDANPNWLRG